MLYNIFDLLFNKESHCGELVREFRFILCIKRFGMFPFKIQLFQGCKSDTEPINIKSVVQHVIRYQVLLGHITKPIPSIVAAVQHVCQVTLSTSLRTHQPFVYGTKYCWWHITKRFELNTVCKSLRYFINKI
jgi:hypothetical protein